MVRTIRDFGFIKPGMLDPIDFVDTVNVFFLGPNAAVKEKNRRKAQKEFSRQFREFKL